MHFIDLQKQYKLIEQDVLAGIRNVLDHGQYIMGPEIDQLEQVLAEFVGVKHAISNSSGTDALLMALMAADIKPGDEVITSAFSFFATAEVIALCGAVPVFVDIKADTYNLDPNLLEEAITPKTKAIMPVSLYGQCPDIDKINLIAEKFGLSVIEDGAQSFGATYKKKYSCGLTTIGCTSFFPSKPLGGYGDSGACFTNDDDLARKLKEIRIHGQSARYCHSQIGINGRMDTIQAAILLQKFKLFHKEIELRQKVAERYNHLLSSICKLPVIDEHATSVYAQYTIEVENREIVQKFLQTQNIPTAVHYPIAMHFQPALKYLGYTKGSFPIAEKVSNSVMSLPMHPYLTEKEQVAIAGALKSALSTNLESA